MTGIKLLFILLLFFVHDVTAQVSLDLRRLNVSCGFGHFLLEDGDYLRAANEFERCFAKKSIQDGPNDTLRLMSGWSYRKAGKPGRSNQVLSRIHPDNNRLFSMGHAIVSLNYFDRRENEKSNEVLKMLISEDPSGPYVPFLQTLRTANYIHLDNQEAINESLGMLPEDQHTMLKTINSEYNLSRGKSPFLAASMSAVAPGLGKLYTNRHLDGLYSLIMVGASAWQAYSSYRNKGFDSIGLYLYGGIALYFYGGNVYGSFLSAREYNYKHRKQFETDLDEYIHRQF